MEIRFPRSTDPDPNLVVIAGKDEDSVYDCIEQLRIEEEEFLQVGVWAYPKPLRFFSFTGCVFQPAPVQASWY